LLTISQVVKNQNDADYKLRKLVETMVQVYSFVSDTDFLPHKLQTLEDKALAIVKQTVECVFFIQEYTDHGFGGRSQWLMIIFPSEY
jgi:hypothetical protein